MQHNNQHITQLLRECKNGKQSAQFEIYKLYYKAMYNTAVRILKDSFEAEDVMQESFLIAFEKLSTFKAEVSFGAWLKRIVINKSITHLRKKSKIKEVPLDVVKEQTDESIEDTNYEALSPKEIISGINKLKDNYRIALTLNLIEGYDYEEISEIMMITNQNSRTTISRAKNKLRTLLKTDYAR
ncbi:RNA polymerase sigma factor [Aureibaculum sp. 2210JD6-5]|uniref:RNA polymerase sigma factor n=1 Tax=Aureibaculum sp. 2210JD6-5 TaxID=3103957 RepID=UPI002AAD356A|nr:RNA polymerase sigma factor [Aureibaculum sp. 2210JD6-5]MDY7395599.1 RNA polymerase sigma factor [Aureibaculum sp. 2210JD6-5]